MSLKLHPPRRMPADTAQVGSKLLPADSPYRLIGDQLFEQYRDEDFVDLYSSEGKPAISPVMLNFILVFQHLEKLSDRQAAEAVRVRLDWKYALHLPLDYQGFDFSVLSEFRDRLIEHEAERQMFDQQLEQLQALGLVKRRGRQRTDSLAILTKMRRLNRVERVAETLRLAVRALVQTNREWCEEMLPPSWEERYGERVVLERLSEIERKQLDESVGADGRWLLRRLQEASTPSALQQQPEVQLLATVWEQQFEVIAGQVVFREADKYDGRRQIQTPHDPEARYSKKGAQRWVGDKVQVTETDDEGFPHLITDIAVTTSVEPDCNVLTEIQDRLAERELAPGEHLVDGAYMSAENLVQSDKREIDLVGPVATNHSPQTRLPNGITAEQFQINQEAGTATCPAGHTVSGSVRQDGGLTFRYRKSWCAACPLCSNCCTGQAGRTLGLAPHYGRLQAARLRQQTEAFKDTYRKHRGGVEGALSAAVRGHGLRVGRYVGQDKRHLQALLTGCAINLRRASCWLAGERPQKRPKGLGLATTG
jgi:transposase